MSPFVFETPHGPVVIAEYEFSDEGRLAVFDLHLRIPEGCRVSRAVGQKMEHYVVVLASANFQFEGIAAHWEYWLYPVESPDGTGMRA